MWGTEGGGEGMGTNEGNAGVCEGRHCGLEEDVVWVGWRMM